MLIEEFFNVPMVVVTTFPVSLFIKIASLFIFIVPEFPAEHQLEFRAIYLTINLVLSRYSLKLPECSLTWRLSHSIPYIGWRLGTRKLADSRHLLPEEFAEPCESVAIIFRCVRFDAERAGKLRVGRRDVFVAAFV